MTVLCQQPIVLSAERSAKEAALDLHVVESLTRTAEMDVAGVTECQDGILQMTQ